MQTNEPGRARQPMKDYLHPPKGSVLIIDEAQNLFKPSKAERDREGSENLRKHLLADAAGKGDVMLFSLTATPGDTAAEYMSMLNIVRPTGAPVLTLAEVVADPTRARGLLSYADIRGDKTHYGTIVGGPKNYEVPHSPAYYGGVLDGETVDSAQQKGVQDFFKSDKNLAGEKLKIFVTTEYEGLDLWHLRNVHLVAPLPTQALDDQAVGRALRYCGHKGDATSVTVARYFGVAPPSEQVAEALEGAGGVTKAGKPRKTRGDKLEKVKEAESQLLALNEALAKAGYSERPKARDANSYVYYDAVRRAAPLEAFLTCLKGVSIECGLLDQIQAGAKITCGAACKVKLNAAGTDIESGAVAFKNKAAKPSSTAAPNKKSPVAPNTPNAPKKKAPAAAAKTAVAGKTVAGKTAVPGKKAPAVPKTTTTRPKTGGPTFLNKGVRVAVKPRARSRSPPPLRRRGGAAPGIVQQIINFFSGSSPPAAPKRTKYAGQSSGVTYA